MLRGTQVLTGEAAVRYRTTLRELRLYAKANNFHEVVVPAIWGADTFHKKIVGQTKDQMWEFKDRGGRDCCLIPEVTGIIQDLYEQEWSRSWPKPIKIFYEARCYRYERPQAGRYREFTQFGVEVLGVEGGDEECKALLKGALDLFAVKYEFVPRVKRGLGYYIEDGFEVECPQLGAQKQIAGGGRYQDGIGWAIGIERLLLAIDNGDRSIAG